MCGFSILPEDLSLTVHIQTRNLLNETRPKLSSGVLVKSITEIFADYQ